MGRQPWRMLVEMATERRWHVYADHQPSGKCLKLATSDIPAAESRRISSVVSAKQWERRGREGGRTRKTGEGVLTVCEWSLKPPRWVHLDILPSICLMMRINHQPHLSDWLPPGKQNLCFPVILLVCKNFVVGVTWLKMHWKCTRFRNWWSWWSNAVFPVDCREKYWESLLDMGIGFLKMSQCTVLEILLYMGMEKCWPCNFRVCTSGY